jgi:hypothetical protein
MDNMNERKMLDNNVVKPDLTLRINDNEYTLLDTNSENNLDSKIEDVNSFMKNNTGLDLSEEEKDNVYAQCVSLYNEYKTELTNQKFNLLLNREQYNLLTDILIKKLEYNIDTVFIAIELTNTLGRIGGTKFANNDEIKEFPITATEMTYIYHLIATYKVKGLTKEAYTFGQLLTRIGDISKVINYYDGFAKSLKDDITKWVVNMGPVEGEVIPGTKLDVEAVSSDDLSM